MAIESMGFNLFRHTYTIEQKFPTLLHTVVQFENIQHYVAKFRIVISVMTFYFSYYSYVELRACEKQVHYNRDDLGTYL